MAFKIITPEPNPEVIDICEQLTERARSGDVQSLIAWAETNEGLVIEVVAGNTVKEMPTYIGHLELWLLRLKAEHMWTLKSLRDISDRHPDD